jgi:hypothetical protein
MVGMGVEPFVKSVDKSWDGFYVPGGEREDDGLLARALRVVQILQRRAAGDAREQAA